jgi:hypothetical protein
MSQEIQTKGGGITSGTTGAICTKTGLYKATDGKIEFIEYIDVNTAFPPYPGGNGKKSCTWTRLSVAADGNRTSYTAVMVEPGTI